MQLLLGFLLFFGLLIFVALLGIGYLLYQSSQKKNALSDSLAHKESELIDLYQSLERMMEEIDSYVVQAKEEMADERQKMKVWHDEICTEISESIGNVIEDEPRVQTPIIELASKKKNSDLEVLQQKVKNQRDLRGGKIKALYKQGMPIADIAREMDMGQGEVQLLLNLRNKRI